MTVESRRALGSRYELIERIGSGAMGEVWRASDRRGGVDVAAKLLRRELTTDPEILGRFIQERAILTALRHPNIVQVHDLVVEGDDLAIVMDLVAGGSLGDRLREQGTLASADAVGVTASVLDALAYAHASKTLHRDVKPDNVLLAASGQAVAADVRLSDFSIARLAQESTVQATGLLGTPAYMPPELFVDGTFSAASDVYATGILLYELLAGRTPFAGSGNAHTIGNRHVQMAPPELPIAPELWNILQTMLSKDPKRRMTTTATAEALRALSADVLNASALPVQPVPNAWVPAGGGLADLTGGAIHVRDAEADTDLGRTNLKGGSDWSRPEVLDGAVETIAPRRATADDAVGTQLGRVAERPSAPTLQPEASITATKRRTWIWVLSAVAVVALIVGLVVFVGPHLKGMGRKVSGADAVAKPVQFADLPSGLRTTVSGAIGEDGKTIELQFEFASSVSELSGDILEVLPPVNPDEQDCPAPTADGWTGGRAESFLDSPVEEPCGFALFPENPIAARGRAMMSVTLDAEMEDSRSLESWIRSIETKTNAALKQPRSDDRFVAQRISGLRVEADPVENTPATVSYRVVPEWTSGAANADEYLFQSPGAQQGSAVLRQLVGSIDTEAGEVSVTKDKSCPQLNIQGLVVTANTHPASCTLNVRVGAVNGSGGVSISGPTG